jgi:extracellular factor (EF) 3-hydroxypalmitic acid methyl ester biosynthesis protein
MNYLTNGNGNGQAPAPPQPPLVKPPNPAVQENGVVFRTADGIQRHGVIVRVMPHTAYFEVHDPTMILKLSETLQDFQIILQGQTTCSGRAVVCSIVESGFKTACEVRLREMDWSGLNPAATLKQNNRLDEQFKVFLNGWEDQCRVKPEFKNAAIDLLSFFSDAQVWLNRVELGIRNLPVQEQARAEQSALLQLNPHFIRATGNINEKFEHELNQVEPELRPLHQAFVRKFLHPVTQCSPFMHRAFEKPLGYAGDFEVVDMMFRNPFQGGSYFAKLLNAYALQLPPVVAHRNRIQYLQKKLEDESLHARTRGLTLKVFNLGCGPAREVQQFLAESRLSSQTSFVLADFEEKTLTHTSQVLRELKVRHQRNTVIKTVKLSVAQLIKQHERREKPAGAEQFDFIYCAGLFDYLTDAVCQRLMDAFYALLAPEGLLVATNVDRHAAINQMECFLDWHLQYRNTEKMRALTPGAANPGDVVIKSDPSGANIFIEVRKPGQSGP